MECPPPWKALNDWYSPAATAPGDCPIVQARERSDEAWQKAEALYVFDSKKFNISLKKQVNQDLSSMQK